MHNNNQIKKLSFTPQKIQLDKFAYTFATRNFDLNHGRFWTKKLVKNMLPPIESFHLKEIFEVYNIPQIDKTRLVKVSPFQYIPIMDMTALIMMFFIAIRLF